MCGESSVLQTCSLQLNNNVQELNSRKSIEKEVFKVEERTNMEAVSAVKSGCGTDHFPIYLQQIPCWYPTDPGKSYMSTCFAI